MVRALFRQLVLLVASLVSSAALMAVVVTVDGAARGQSGLELLTQRALTAVQVADAAPANALPPTTDCAAAATGCKARDASPF